MNSTLSLGIGEDRKQKSLELQAKRDRCDKKSCKVQITDKQGSATGRYYYKPSRRWKSLDRALKKSYRKRRE